MLIHLLKVTDFIHYLLSNLRWDGTWVNRLYLTGSVQIPHPGNTFSLDLQDDARALLLSIGDFPPNADFDTSIQHLVPSLEFFLGQSNHQMMVRVYHTIGPERLSVAMARKGHNFKSVGEDDGLAPRHIMSFSASFVSVRYLCLTTHSKRRFF